MVNKDDIYNMNPAELNHRIAIYVMRWRRIKYDDLPLRHWPWLTDEGKTYSLPDFSNDINAAWKVHKKLIFSTTPIRTLYFLALADVLTDKYGGPLSVWTAPLENFNPDTICRAALMAVLEEL